MHMTACVQSQMTDKSRARPPGQQRRCSELGVTQTVDGLEQFLVCRGAPLDAGIELPGIKRSRHGSTVPHPPDGAPCDYVRGSLFGTTMIVPSASLCTRTDTP